MTRAFFGLAAAAGLALFHEPPRQRVYLADDFDDGVFEVRLPPPYIPNDHGPVIDTTPESKRARRRRLARAASHKTGDGQ